MGTCFLNRRHFVFYHGDAPSSKLDILTLNFPPILVGKCKNVFFGGYQNSNPGPPVCQPGILPLDQRGIDNILGLELCFYTYVAGNSNWECPTWNKEHPHGKKQNGVCSRYLSPSLVHKCKPYLMKASVIKLVNVELKWFVTFCKLIRSLLESSSRISLKTCVTGKWCTQMM